MVLEGTEISLSKFENFLFICNDSCVSLVDLDSPNTSNNAMLGLGGGLSLSPMPMGDMASIMDVSKVLGRLSGNTNEVLQSKSDLNTMQFSFFSSYGSRSASNTSMSNIESSSKARVSMLAKS